MPQFVGAVLTPPVGSEQTLRFKDGATWRFRELLVQSFPLVSAGFLVEQADRVSNRVTIRRSPGPFGFPQIQSIEDATGRAITVQYTSDKITRLQDPLGRTVQYGYDTNGRLATVTDSAGGVTRYTYPADGGIAIATITDVRAITYLTNAYTGPYLTRQTRSAGTGDPPSKDSATHQRPTRRAPRE